MSDNHHGSDLPRSGSDQSGSAPDAGHQEPTNSSLPQAEYEILPVSRRTPYEIIRHMPSSINTIDGLFDHMLTDQGVDSEFLLTQLRREFTELQCRSPSPQHIVNFSAQHRRLARRVALPDQLLRESYRKALEKFHEVKTKIKSLPTSYKYEDVVNENYHCSSALRIRR
jgi:hypothetical protein